MKGLVGFEGLGKEKNKIFIRENKWKVEVIRMRLE